MPTVKHGKWKSSDLGSWISDFEDKTQDFEITPKQLRWLPQKIQEYQFFHTGIKTMMGAGSPQMKNGLSIGQYSFTKNMTDIKTALYSADGDILLVPQQGTLLCTSEFGKLRVPPQEILVIPRGVKFSIDSENGEPARGWITECYKGHFAIPDLGPIGSNGLANERDFSTPVAAYEDLEEKWTICVRYHSRSFQYEQDHSPYDVVAWHGNYYPFKYDLTKFNTMGSISFDHPAQSWAPTHLF